MLLVIALHSGAHASMICRILSKLLGVTESVELLATVAELDYSSLPPVCVEIAHVIVRALQATIALCD